MKKILSAAAALSVLAFAQQAQAADFILSNNNANPQYNNFRLTFASPALSSASLFNIVGSNAFTDNYFFAPSVPNSIGSGSATANSNTGLSFLAAPNGLTITGYTMTMAAFNALVSGFSAGAGGYAGDAATLVTESAAAPVVTFNGAGSSATQGVNFIPLSGSLFYRITFSGVGTTAGSQYDGNLTSVTVSVPEPATWAMMLVGFGLMGFALRRNRSSAPRVKFAF